MGDIYKIQKPFVHLPTLQKLWHFEKNGTLGRSLQFATSLSDIWSTTTSYETHNSITHLPFVIIGHLTIIFMSRPFIWDFQTAHWRIGCRETDRWPKITQHRRQLYGKLIQLLSFHYKIPTYKILKLIIFGWGGRYMNSFRGL